MERRRRREGEFGKWGEKFGERRGGFGSGDGGGERATGRERAFLERRERERERDSKHTIAQVAECEW